MLSRIGQKVGPKKKEPKGVPFDSEILKSRFFTIYLVKTVKFRVPKNRGVKTVIMQWSSCPRMSIGLMKKRNDFRDF